MTHVVTPSRRLRRNCKIVTHSVKALADDVIVQVAIESYGKAVNDCAVRIAADGWTVPSDYSARRLMKNFDSRVYSVNDFVEWDSSGQLQLNPAFQRRPVWSDKAKSYLMDTIIRGKPIPKVFIRQKLNVTTRTSVREIVDGQQRLRTILSYVKDGFAINRQHHKEYGGKKFSQLPEDVRGQLLQFEIAVDILINLPDVEILDIFGRLNSYAVVLNEQEKINSDHFGQFKTLVDHIGRKYSSYWVTNRILTDRNVLRMGEVSLVADVLIALKEGIESKKLIKRFYDVYEDNYEEDPDVVEKCFDNVVSAISLIFPEGLSETEYKRPFLYYSLFTSIAHCLVGVPGLDVDRPPLIAVADFERARNVLDRIGYLFSVSDVGTLSVDERSFLYYSLFTSIAHCLVGVPGLDVDRPPLIAVADFERARNVLDRIGYLFSVSDVGTLSVDERSFLQDSRRATTDGPVRKRRTIYLLKRLYTASSG